MEPSANITTQNFSILYGWEVSRRRKPRAVGSTMALSTPLVELHLHSSIHFHGVVLNAAQGIFRNKIRYWWSYTATSPYIFAA